METVEAKGHNGTVIFDGAFVTIKRSGFLARTTVGKGEKRIPIGSITAVQWKEPGALMNGFIQFTLQGGVERRSGFGHQTNDAVSDENSVIVVKKQAPAFHALRDAVEAAIAAHDSPASAPSQGPTLEDLARAHDAGILTDEEFAAAKRKALGL